MMCIKFLAYYLIFCRHSVIPVIFPLPHSSQWGLLISVAYWTSSSSFAQAISIHRCPSSLGLQSCYLLFLDLMEHTN